LCETKDGGDGKERVILLGGGQEKLVGVGASEMIAASRGERPNPNSVSDRHIHSGGHQRTLVVNDSLHSLKIIFFMYSARTVGL
jgi:hypothetical protein